MQSSNNGYRHIWLLAGTGEGPILADALQKQGWRVTVSVVSTQASWPYLEMSLTSVFVGALQGAEGIKKILNNAQHLHDGFDWVIDATHPFALEISTNLHEACNEFKQPLLRFERPYEDLPSAHKIQALRDLSNYSLQGRNFLIALGVRHLSEAINLVRRSGAKAFARVLPTPESLRQTLKCSLNESHYAIIRPFQGSRKGDFEHALCRRWSITDVLCRQSGGPIQKYWQEVCQREKMDLWLISHPNLVDGVKVVYTLRALLDMVSKCE